MAQKSVHVIACAEGWAVEEDGRQVSVRNTRAQAEQIARAFATAGRGEVVVHARDGGTERPRGYGSETRATKRY